SLIQDVLGGFFILMENQLAVGDSVTVSGVTGNVETLNLRTIAVRDAEGTLHYIPNRLLTLVSSHSRNWNRVVVDVGVPLRTAPEEPLLMGPPVAHVGDIGQRHIGSEGDPQILPQSVMTGLGVAKLAAVANEAAHQARQVQSKVDERDDGADAMKGAGDVHAAEPAHQPLGPARVVELQRHSRRHEQQEAHHHQEVQKTLERPEAHVDLVVLENVRLGVAERRRITQEQHQRTNKPQHRMHAEEGERAQHDRGHEDERPVERRVLGAVRVVRVGDVRGEAGRGLGMALAARFQLVLRRQPAGRVADRDDVVMSVAVIAGGYAGQTQRDRFAVKSLPVALEPVRVALPAALIARQFERGFARRDDLVGGMAGRANRAPGIARLQQLPVNALAIGLLHAEMTLSAGLRHVVLVHARARIRGRPDLVNAMTVIARRRDDQPLLRQSAAVHAVDVLLGGVRLAHVSGRHDARVRVALGARCGKVQLVRPGLRVSRGEDVVLAVAISTVGRRFVAAGDGLPMHTARVFA
ncbi:MAG: mechanosensitive ion channel, partial [Planctomycetes bacterium]|nr:mechanosensitive ion channel [Planctomycetota bacterium]